MTIIGLAGPSFGNAEKPGAQSANARVLVLDMSQSVYANDIKPNRLAQIRYKALDILPLFNQGQTGLVAYAGDAYTLSPLTSDAATLANAIQYLSPEIMPFQGARADLAVKQAVSLMEQAGITQGDIVLFADDLSPSESKQIEKQLSGKAFTLSILAFGSQSGAPIPLTDGTLLTDSRGNTVVAKTSYSEMRQLAKSAGGQFASYQSDNKDIEHLVKTSRYQQVSGEQSQTLDVPINHGYWLMPLVVLLILPLFRKGFLFSLCGALLLSATYAPSSQASLLDSAFNNRDQRGAEAFAQGNYQQAAELFDDARWRAAAHYQAQEYQAAIEALEGLNSVDDLYNRGNALAQSGDIEAAIESYQDVLKTEPDHQDAKYNLELLQQQQQQQQQKPEGDDKDKQGQQQKEADNSDSASQDSQAQDQSNDAQSEETPQSGASSENDPESNAQSDNSAEQQAQNQQGTNESQQDPSPSVNQEAASNKKPESPDESTETSQTTTSASQQQEANSDLRQLEQVESVRDPSLLLKAQMLLQAKEKPAPSATDNNW